MRAAKSAVNDAPADFFKSPPLVWRDDIAEPIAITRPSPPREKIKPENDPQMARKELPGVAERSRLDARIRC